MLVPFWSRVVGIDLRSASVTHEKHISTPAFISPLLLFYLPCLSSWLEEEPPLLGSSKSPMGPQVSPSFYLYRGVMAVNVGLKV